MIGIGIIGSGVGIRTHAPGFKQAGNVKLVGLFSPNLEKAKRLVEEHGFTKLYTNYKDLCDDPDIDLVIIASPNSHHVEHTIYALSQNKHVLCEKPLALTSEECQEIVNEQSKFHSSFTAVNHQLRFNPYIQKIREIVQSNELGKAYNIRILHQGMAFANPSFPWSWSFDTKAGGGVRWAMGSHLIDLIHFIFEKKIVSVFGGMHTVIPKRMKEGVEVEVNASAEFSGTAMLEDGTGAYISSTAAAFSGNKFNISIFFEKGEVEFDLSSKIKVYKHGLDKPEVFKNIPSVYEDEVKNNISIFSGSFRYFANNITRALKDNDLSLLSDAASFDDGLKVTKVIEAFYDSYVSGKSIQLHEKLYASDSY